MSILQSMTGFGTGDAMSEGGVVRCDLRSVNGRGLDVKMRLPTGLEAQELTYRKALGAHFARGNIQCSFQLERSGDEKTLSIDEELFVDLARKAARLAVKHGMRPPSSEAILAIRGVVTGEEEIKVDMDALAKAASEALEKACESLKAAREREGAELESILQEHLEQIESLTEQAKADPDSQPDAILARLKTQIERLLDADTSIDPVRLNAEAAILATKVDTAEETARLKAHVSAARELLASGGAVGRKLDFLTQELNREANTLCSKSSSSSLTAIGLDLKAVIDQFREQVQNLQ